MFGLHTSVQTLQKTWPSQHAGNCWSRCCAGDFSLRSHYVVRPYLYGGRSHCKHMKSFGHLWHPLVVQHCEACACQFNTKCIVEPFECMFHLRLWSLLLQNCRISDCNLNCPCILVDICRFCVCPPAYPLFFDPNVCFSLSHCLLFAVQFVHAEWSPSLLQSWCL